MIKKSTFGDKSLYHRRFYVSTGGKKTEENGVKSILKRNCNGCRASEETSCQLGFKVKPIYVETGKHLGRHLENQPMEECPKPKTLKEMVLQWKMQEKG